MTSPDTGQPGQASIAALAIQVTALRGQVRQITARLDKAGLTGNLNLADRFEDLARTLRDTLHQAAPAGPPAPTWLGLDAQQHAAQLTTLRDWAATVLRGCYSSYELADCWDRHPTAVWELSTLAAEWHRTYTRPKPDLAAALEFYDRWLPGTMRRITAYTARCTAGCTTLQRHLWQPASGPPGPAHNPRKDQP